MEKSVGSNDAVPSSMLSLPPEILFEVAEQLDALKDVNSLCQVTCQLHDLLDFTLYQRGVKSSSCNILKWAIINNEEETVYKTLRAGADVNSTNSNDSYTPLTTAIEKRKLNMVIILLENGADINPNQKCGSSLTPLQLALQLGQTVMAKVLLDKGAIVEGPGWRPIFHSVTTRSISLIRTLVGRGADIDAEDEHGDTSLWVAMNQLEPILVRDLLANGADPAFGLSSDQRLNLGWSGLHSACLTGNLERVIQLIRLGSNVHAQTDNGWQPLHAASIGGHVSVVKRLLERGANVGRATDAGVVPLHIAATGGFVELAGLLLSGGALVAQSDSFDRTAIHYASLNGHIEVVELLLQCGAEVNYPWYGFQTPLTLASQGASLELVNLLLTNGAFIGVEDDFGRTPPHWAALRGRTEIMERLIEEGGDDINACDGYGFTPLHRAAEAGSADKVTLLLHYGADPKVQDRFRRKPAAYARDYDVRVMLREAEKEWAAKKT